MEKIYKYLFITQNVYTFVIQFNNETIQINISISKTFRY